MSGWNIFAHELRSVLNRRGLDLPQLENHARIHREKVRRLIQSLHSKDIFPVLNVEEMQQVISMLSLDRQEISRLHAAILASSVQQMLCLHIQPEDAQHTAEQVFPIILQSLQPHTNIQYQQNKRGGDFEALEDFDAIGDSEALEDNELDIALEAIDTGTQKLHASMTVKSHNQRVKQALEARAIFTEATKYLERMGITFQLQDSWQYWYSEARKNLSSTNTWLDELNQQA
jgi:hypothetical protein